MNDTREKPAVDEIAALKERIAFLERQVLILGDKLEAFEVFFKQYLMNERAGLLSVAKFAEGKGIIEKAPN